MFTGIVEEIGQIKQVEDLARSAERPGGAVRVRIAAQQVMEQLQLGDSIAVSGCCLTVVATSADSFVVELSNESLAKTAPRWHEAARVNLERAMAANSRFGGHIVSGHVEAVGTVLTCDAQPGAYVLEVEAPPQLAAYLIPKGSITVDGVSLTVVDVGGVAGSRPEWPAHRFSLWLIPHTLEVSTLGELQAGSYVNLEADVVAKYLERISLIHQQHPTLAHNDTETNA